MEITAVGPKVTVKLNGTTVVDANLEDHAAAAGEHPGLKRRRATSACSRTAAGSSSAGS